MRIVGVFLIYALNLVDAHRILGLFPTPIRSHYTFYEKLMIGLVNKGHEVDVLTHFPQEGVTQNYNILSVAGSVPNYENNVSVENFNDKSTIKLVMELFQIGNEACAAVLRHPETKKLKETRVKYDLVIMEMFATDCLLPFAYLYQVPLIGISSNGIMPWTDDRMGNPDNPSYIPNYFISIAGRVDFFKKLEITIMNVLSKILYFALSTIPAEIRGLELFGSNVPGLEEIAKNTSLLFVNTHFSIDHPRPLVPGVLEVGGLHIGEAQELSGTLLEFVESAKNGIIYFSMGTVLNMSTFDSDILKDVTAVFKSLPQKIIIKSNDKNFGGNSSKNVYLDNWLPQLDILCHPNTKLFITHGGTLGLQEAAYCGVPILGIPSLPYQELNIRNFVEKEAGSLLNYQDIDVDSLKETVEDLLKNEKYKRNAQQISKRFRDRPVSPLDTATFWVEYVIRNGGKHLRTKGADLIFFEYFLLDVLIIAAIFFGIIITVAFFLLWFLQDLFDRPPPEDWRKNEKSNNKETKSDKKSK